MNSAQKLSYNIYTLTLDIQNILNSILNHCQLVQYLEMLQNPVHYQVVNDQQSTKII
jgi:hypothetical protein